MSLIRSNIKKLVTPKYICVDGFIKVMVNPNFTHHKKHYGFPKEYVKDIMNEEEVIDLQKRIKGIDDYTSIKNSGLRNNKIHFNLINKYLDESEHKEQLKRDIFEHTFFKQGFELWDITNLARKYKLRGKVVFLSMAGMLPPSSLMGAISHNPENSDNERLSKFYDARSKGMDDYVCFDWVNGTGIKNHYPKDIHNDNTPFVLNMRRFNDRNNYVGYNRVLSLVEDRIKNNIFTNDFKRYEPHNTTNEDNNNKTTKKYDHCDEFNKLIKEIVVDNKQRYHNHRKGGFMNSGDCLWDYQMKPFYDEYLKDNTKELDIGNFFIMHPKYYNGKDNRTVDDYLIEPDYSLKLENVSVANMLMFGKDRVTFQMLELLLSFVRISITEYTDYIDNYGVTFSMDCSGGGKNYTISFHTDDKHINSLEFARTHHLKRYVAKYLIQLMNEIPPELLNHHNYEVISNYYKTYDITAQRFENVIRGEEERIKSTSTNA